MDYCRVVGPRGLCRPLDKQAGVPNKQFASRTLSGLLGSTAKQADFSQKACFRMQGRAGQGQGGQGRAGQGRAGQGRAGQGRAGQGRQAAAVAEGFPDGPSRLQAIWGTP